MQHSKFKILNSFHIFIIAACFMFCVACSVTAEAASLRFATEAIDVAPGSEFAVKVLLDTDVPLNVLRAEISLSSDSARLVDVEVHRSVVNLMQGNPKILDDGTLILEGGMLPPFQGNSGEIATLIFESVEEGNFPISLREGKGYIADGEATFVALSAKPMFISVKKNAEKVSIVSAPDATPPSLEVSIVRSSFERGPFAIIDAKDEGSGLREVFFRTRTGFVWSDWERVGNAVVIPDGACAVQVRALNKQGLESIETMYLWNRIVLVFGTPLFLLFAGIFIFLYNRKARCKKA